MKNIFITAILFLTLTGCERDPIKAGINSTVFGNVHNIYNEPIENQKFVVNEYKKKFVSDGGVSYNYIGQIGSGTSNASGNYSINFTTSGKGDYYKLSPEHNSQIWTYQQDPVEIENIGGSNELNFTFLKLHLCILNITVNNVDFLPVTISTFLTENSELNPITENNTTITRQIYIGNEETSIRFYRKISNSQGQAATFIIPPTNSTDTMSFDIDLDNSDFQ